MKGTSLFSGFIALLLTIALVSGCKKDDSLNSAVNTNDPQNQYTPPQNNYTPLAVAFHAPVQGFVTDDAGNPVGGIDVQTGNKTAITDANGYFRIEEAPFTGDFCYIKAVKKGYFTGSVTIQGKSGGNYAADIVLMAQNNVQSFSAAQGKTITLQGGAEVQLPANSYITTTGSAYTGNVNIAIAHLNPEAKNFSNLIPGGDLRAFDANEKNVQLYSYGMLNIEMRDDAGNLLQLAKNSKATLIMPVPATMLGTAPATIPLWYFDEIKGIWIEEGSAALQGNNYVGTVSHFTPWNCDEPAPPSKIRGRVVDCEGNPLKFAKVRVDQRLVGIDDEGVFATLVVSNSQVSIDVYDQIKGELKGVGFTVQTLPPDQLKDVGELVLKDASKVEANVIDCEGLPFNGYGYINYGNYTKKVLVANGKFSSSNMNVGGQAELTFVSAGLVNQVTKTVDMPNVAQMVDAGDIVVCGKNGRVNKISFTYQIGAQTPVKVSYLMPPIDYCSRSNDFTNIVFSDASSLGMHDDTYQVVFGYDGDKPGTFILETQPYVGFTYRLKGSNKLEILSTDMELVVDKFGTKIDEVVSGTFSGIAINGTEQVIITEGSFETVRIY